MENGISRKVSAISKAVIGSCLCIPAFFVVFTLVQQLSPWAPLFINLALHHWLLLLLFFFWCLPYPLIFILVLLHYYVMLHLLFFFPFLRLCYQSYQHLSKGCVPLEFICFMECYLFLLIILCYKITIVSVYPFIGYFWLYMLSPLNIYISYINWYNFYFFF